VKRPEFRGWLRLTEPRSETWKWILTAHLNRMHAAALEHLATVDPVMKQLIAEHGPCGLAPETRRSPFQSLVQAVAHQQLHATAAGNILARFKKLFPGRKFPRPADLAGITDEQIRACGFSFAKIRAIRDIAAKTLSGVVPTGRQIVILPDEEIIARLTEVRGVGRWTVEMLLIFQLGRPDVLPGDDFGVRNGFRLAYKKRALPKPKDLLRFGERWRPHATTAAWYLWRAADASRKKK
jgi:DNA-3-methyladenine glycosylase II